MWLKALLLCTFIYRSYLTCVKIVTIKFIHTVELVSHRLCASSSLNISPNSSQNIDRNLYSQEQSKMIILIIAIDRDFKILTESEQYCGMNFASLTSRKIEYLFTYLLVSWVFSPNIYFIIICVYVWILRIILLTLHFKSFLVCKGWEVKINNFKISLAWWFSLFLHDLTVKCIHITLWYGNKSYQGDDRVGWIILIM